MSKWNRIGEKRKAQVLTFNRQRKADSLAAADMHLIAQAFTRLPKGILAKTLTGDILAILARYGVEVQP